ncbi:MAG: DinB family protein [Cytophagales bacterium]|uniref:DinB family protein n=1 Tax=Cyclobacterium marinum TaxID=104 RepID=UPI0011ED551C|nr:DinB family protein [Cyclobacterium marinum]MBI0400529.1 DinB family protein [Cyclobacterium marinum]MBR9774638.1 DinB family protein [Cytophagales bacterium]|tara:strand:+ start:45556 stop:46098 length:543 start_codon:yes stop_codon:yes gene_type:complete
MIKEKADAWQMELTEITWQYEKILEDFDLTTLNVKPSPEQWSPMEIVHHLILVNTSYFPIFDQIILQRYKSPLMGKLPFYGSKMGNIILASMNKSSKIKTFNSWKPSDKLHNNDLKIKFFTQQDLLSNYLQKLEPFLGKNLMISSPANKWIVYPLDSAIDIILAHEKRHLSQIKNILKNI